MKHKVIFSRFIALLGAMGMAFALFLCPVASLPSQAAIRGNGIVQPMHDDIRYRYAVIGTKLYKRLFNYSTSEWIGDWIFVRNWP